MNRILPAARAIACGATLLMTDTGVAMADDAWQAVVFMYHRFGEDRYPSTSVTLDQFDAHLDYLTSADYEVWPLERIVEHLQSGHAIPDRTVAITIDDAYRSVYEEAYPRLRERGLPYTVFVATDAVDDEQAAIMTWDQMREMQDDGATFANHSATHGYLARPQEGETEERYRARLQEDIQRGRQRLEEELGSGGIPDIFAYPYGEYNRVVADIVRTQGYVAFGQHSGAIGPLSDTHALPRFAMAEAYADPDEFRMKASTMALPVEELSPWDPLIDRENPPVMRVRLQETSASLDRLTCFVSQQGSVKPEWEDKAAGVFTVVPPNPLPTGRSRYNCTAPSNEPGRYFWFSQQWIVLPD